MLRSLVSAAVSTSAVRLPATAQSVAAAASYTDGAIRGGGGSFARKESAEEDRYAHEHELAAIRKLKAELSKREAAVAQKLVDAGVTPPAAEPEASSASYTRPESLGASTVDSSYGGAVRSGGGSFGKREAAEEGKYVREHEREKIAHLKEELAKKGKN
ncbi:hypothetical protein BC831DRAFT_461374 [Entophlyctis helioformis]|nr:hypothetical protein BC831DRAFT_461374 [Entophlyctis helioformis]